MYLKQGSHSPGLRTLWILNFLFTFFSFCFLILAFFLPTEIISSFAI